MFESDALFHSFLERQAEWQQRCREQLCEALRTSEIPLPDDLRAKIVRLSYGDREEVLRCHPGRHMAERLSSYRTSLGVFESSVSDLLEIISVFGQAYLDGGILNRRNKAELRRIEQKVQKELFCATNAAHALVDHSTRRLQKVANVPGFKEKLAEAFKDDGLHEFVISLRTVLHHVKMIQAEWSFQHSFRSGTGSASFVLNSEAMIRLFESVISSQKLERVSRFISSVERDIDLGIVFREYRQRVGSFHDWFSGELQSDLFEEVRDYEICRTEGRNFASRMMWSALVGNWLNWETPPNPYDHLESYLTPEELAQTLALPKGSPAQIDKIIHFVDEEQACDENTRKLIHKYFNRATEVHSALQKKG